jgi:hypothetical protein
MHYLEFIRLYDCADNIDIEISEMEYRLIIKQPYDRTNKKDNFLEQIFLHNIHKINMQAMAEYYILKFLKPISPAEKLLDLFINSIFELYNLFN